MVMKQTSKMLKRLCHQPPQKPRKSRETNLIYDLETNKSSKSSDASNPVLSVIQEDEVDSLSDGSQWEHLCECKDMISDSSDNDWLP